MLAGAASPDPCRPRDASAPITRSGWRTAIRSAIAAPIEMPPTTNRLDAAAVGKGQHVVAESGDREALRDRRPPTCPAPGIRASAGGSPARPETPPPPAPRRRRARAGRSPAGHAPPSQPCNATAAALECEPAHAAAAIATVRREKGGDRRRFLPRSAHASPAARRSRRRAGCRTKCAEIDDAGAGRGESCRRHAGPWHGP